MAFQISSPPIGVTVTATPSTKELAARSSNIAPASFYKRRSLNGRQFITTLNGFPFTLNAARQTLADKFPSGLDSSLDSSQSPNTTANSQPVFP